MTRLLVSLLCVVGIVACAMEVRASAPPAPATPDRWSKIESPYFVMLSAGSERETLDWAVEFHVYFWLLAQMVTSDTAGRSPMTVLIFRDDAAMAPFKFQVGGRVSPGIAYMWRSAVASIIAMSGRENAAATRRLVYHDGMHWLMGRYARVNPVWFEEGLAELYSSMEVRGDRVMLGLPIMSHLATLRRNGLMPTEELLLMSRESFLYDEATRDTRLYAQAWLAVHQLFFDAKDNRSAGLARYLADVQRGAASIEAFQQVFGLSPREMDARLAAHLKKEKHLVPGIRFDRASVEGSLRRSTAESWEVDLMLGVLANGGGHKEMAARLLTAASEKNPADPRAHFWLGDMALGREDYGEARRCLDRAIANGATDHLAYYERAAATLREQRPKGDLGGLDPTVVRAVADDLCRAIEQAPAERPAYDFLVALLQVIEKPTEADQRVLVEALRRWPASADFIFVSAQLDEKAGRWSEARVKFNQILELDPPAPPRLRLPIVQHLEALAKAERDAEIKALWEKRDFPLLRQRIDALLPTLGRDQRKRFELFLEQIVVHEKLDQAEAFLKDDRREAARMLLEEIMAAPPVDLAVKERARQLLQRQLK